VKTAHIYKRPIKSILVLNPYIKIVSLFLNIKRW